MTDAGGNNDQMAAQSIARDVAEFFHVTPHSSQQSFCNIDRLLNRFNLELFVYYIKHQRKYKPMVIFEKIQRLKQAILYILSLTNNTDYCRNGSSLLKLLTNLQQSQKSKFISKRSSEESDYNEMVSIHTLHAQFVNDTSLTLGLRVTGWHIAIHQQ